MLYPASDGGFKQIDILSSALTGSDNMCYSPIHESDICFRKLFELDKNTRNNISMCRLLVFEKNTWNCTIVCK